MAEGQVKVDDEPQGFDLPRPRDHPTPEEGQTVALPPTVQLEHDVHAYPPDLRHLREGDPLPAVPVRQPPGSAPHLDADLLRLALTPSRRQSPPNRSSLGL